MKYGADWRAPGEVCCGAKMAQRGAMSPGDWLAWASTYGNETEGQGRGWEARRGGEIALCTSTFRRVPGPDSARRQKLVSCRAAVLSGRSESGT
jgi:hypothetical protein